MDKNIFNPVKGMQDVSGNRLIQLEDMISKIKSIFKLYGGVPLDTPILENIKVVENAYGEEFNKLVYALGGDYKDLILRYDLTLSFARYLINNSINSIKRYTIGKVYRRDSPQMGKGRYREFWQCDFDIAGSPSNDGLQEIEIITLMNKVLKTCFDLDFVIKVNDRELLFAIFGLCNINKDQMKSLSSLIDKIDWKNSSSICLDSDTVSLSEYSKDKLLNIMRELKDLSSNEEILQWIAAQGFSGKYLQNLQNLLNETGLNIILDPFLARGLDYYTGLIYEAYLINNKATFAIAAGGRYDELVEKMGGVKTPIIGVSFGLDRILDVTTTKSQPLSSKFYVASIGDNLNYERLKLCLEIRNFGWTAETNYWKDPKMRQQLNYALSNNIPYMVIIGDGEIKSRKVTVKIIERNFQFTLERDVFLTMNWMV